MKAKISGTGWLVIIPENELEQHQIERWVEENENEYTGDCKITSVNK